MSNTRSNALRRGVALFEAPPLAMLEVKGADHHEFLHRVLSADVKRLDIDRACPAALLTAKGKVIASLVALRRPDAMLLLVERTAQAALRVALERYVVIDDVTIVDDPRAIFGLFGPALATLERIGAQLGALEPYHCTQVTSPEGDFLAIGDDRLATPGGFLIGDADRATKLKDRLCQAGAILLGDDEFEVARIEAGSPKMGAELGEEVMVLEAGQRGAVSFDKGCYIGQEPVCRVNSRGQVMRLLVGLRVLGDRIPAADETLRSATKDDAGRITSAVRSAELDAVIALAYVHRSCAESGTELEVEKGGLARVVDLPHIPVDRRPLVCPSY